MVKHGRSSGVDRSGAFRPFEQQHDGGERDRHGQLRRQARPAEGASAARKKHGEVSAGRVAGGRASLPCAPARCKGSTLTALAIAALAAFAFGAGARRALAAATGRGFGLRSGFVGRRGGVSGVHGSVLKSRRIAVERRLRLALMGRSSTVVRDRRGGPPVAAGVGLECSRSVRSSALGRQQEARAMRSRRRRGLMRVSVMVNGRRRYGAPGRTLRRGFGNIGG